MDKNLKDNTKLMYVNEFNSNLAIVNTFINKKGLKQKAFMRAITAALRVGLDKEDYNYNFQSEEEAMMAATLAKLIDIKLILKMYIQNEQETNNGSTQESKEG
jgi:hypothetical protein